jgi:uncharacterized protein YfaP (DUF2135 family)
LSACEQGQRVDLGLDAGLRVQGGAFVRGPLPAATEGPNVQALYLGQRYLDRGLQNKSFSGVLDPNATAAAVMLDGDRGYWLIAAGFPFPESPDTTSFDAPLSIASSVASGPQTLLVTAIDADSRFGPVRPVEFTLTDHPLPSGKLVISLFWDTESDLDLHVVTPGGSEIYRDHVNSWQPPVGTQAGPDDWKNGGILDFDSNASCIIDGRRNENVTFASVAPPGTYLIRVDTFSLCAASAARYRVEVRSEDMRLAQAFGETTAASTRFSHGAGAGVTALEVSVAP